MLQGEHSAILSTLIKLSIDKRSLFCLFLSDRSTQVLLYVICDEGEGLVGMITNLVILMETSYSGSTPVPWF